MTKAVYYTFYNLINKEGNLVKDLNSFVKLYDKDVHMDGRRCLIGTKLYDILKLNVISPSISHYKLADVNNNFYQLQRYTNVEKVTKKLILL